MQVIDCFALARHQGDYRSWPLETELLLNGGATGKTIPGYVLEAQYQCGDRYLFITSWDCPFEESLDVVLTSTSLDIMDRKSIGAMYTSTWLERHEVAGENQLLLHCDNGFLLRVTVDADIELEQYDTETTSFVPYPRKLNLVSPPRKRWKFW